MDREAAQSPPGCRGLLFLPYLMGERSPHWNPLARGVFVGLTLSHGRAEMLRAVLEGVSFNLRIILEAFTRQGITVPVMRLIGGGAKGALWRQIHADILGIPVQPLLLLEEATSLGAAIAGAVGVGALPDFGAAERIVKVAETLEPRKDVRELYDGQYALFKDVYGVLLPIYPRLSGGSAEASG
jgi:xylulokinase